MSKIDFTAGLFGTLRAGAGDMWEAYVDHEFVRGVGRGDLPEEADEPQVGKSDADADPVMRVAVTSDRMTTAEITDYIDRFVVDRFSTLDGVANVDVIGAQPFAVRIDLSLS